MRCHVAGSVVLVGLTLATSTVSGQIPEPQPAQSAAMERLTGWIGEWEGQGWVATGAGERHEFRIRESVQPKVAGSVLLVQGRGTATDAGGDERVVHEALAVLSFDSAADRYVWRAHSLRGPTPDPEFRLTDAGIEWEYADEERGLRFRFLISLEGERWHEVGEISLDGGVNWFPMLEMTLRRVAPDSLR